MTMPRNRRKLNKRKDIPNRRRLASDCGRIVQATRPGISYVGYEGHTEIQGTKLMVKETRSIRRQILPNGLTVITEQMPHIRSVAIGIWLRSEERRVGKEWGMPP